VVANWSDGGATCRGEDRIVAERLHALLKKAAG
jgi:hypothetical protein